MSIARVIVIILLPTLAACGIKEPPSDAYGNFEADQTTISAETGGRLVTYTVREGERLAAGRVAAVVDTAGLVLERATLRARGRVVRSRIDGVLSRIDVLEEKRGIALRDRERIARLVEDDAAARQQLDEVDDRIRVIDREIAGVRTRISTIERESEAIDAQLAQLEEQLDRHVVRNPIDGTVISSFAEAHELAAPGRPLYTIARLDTLVLKAFVSGAQLPDVRLGMPVDVVVDGPEGALRTLPGTVARIASEAEFTPRLIQTREARVDLVYAVEVRVPNPDGLLKIGMPGEVRFLNATEEG
ncbi:MAG: HlyD family efflux transporter periplasmic adaptor subunit [Rhodothermales bacterium]